MNIFTPSQWLAQFLSARGLSSVTGDALFTYQMKHEEYQALKNVYELISSLKVSNSVFDKNLVLFFIYVKFWLKTNINTHVFHQ